MIWPKQIIPYLISEENFMFLWVWQSRQKNLQPWPHIMRCHREYATVKNFNSIWYVEVVQTSFTRFDPKKYIHSNSQVNLSKSLRKDRVVITNILSTCWLERIRNEFTQLWNRNHSTGVGQHCDAHTHALWPRRLHLKGSEMCSGRSETAWNCFYRPSQWSI